MLDLKKLLDGSVPSIEFNVSLDDCEFVDDSVSGSVKAKGIITNHSGVVLLSGEILPHLSVSCGRCGKEFNYSAPIPLQAKITDKLANEDEDEFLLMTDNTVDEEALVRDSLILELPSRFLCREDCKGLCEICGSDLNVAQCNCQTKERDSRWDVLKDYFSE